MFEQVQLARTFLRMAWLYRWPGMVVAALLSTLGWGFIQSLPNTYEVGVKVFLDSRSMLRPLLSGVAFNTGAASDAALLLGRTLLTRPNLEEVARRADLDLAARTPEQFNGVVDKLMTGIEIASGGRGAEDIYQISYAEQDPRVAKKVVDELLNVFMEKSLGGVREDSASTQSFVNEQISAYEKRLVEAEERLKAFKQQNVGVMPGSQGGYFSRMEEAQATLSQAKLDLEEARRRRDQLKSESSAGVATLSEEDLMTGLDDGSGVRRKHPELAIFDTKIVDLEGRIDELLLNFTDKHPDVIALRRLMGEYQKRQKEKALELAGVPMSDDAGTAGQGDTSFRQQIKLEAAQADAAVAALETRVDVYTQRLDEMAAKVNVVPQIEADLVRLNRDYDITKKQYDQLIERRERMRMGIAAEQSVDEVKIRVIEPSRLPAGPTGPPRILLSSLVLLVALGAGAGTSALLSQLNPRIIDVPDVQNLTGLPVLGVVRMISNDAYRQQRRVELLAFFAVLGGLLALYAGQISLHLLGVDIHNTLAALLGVDA